MKQESKAGPDTPAVRANKGFSRQAPISVKTKYQS